MVSLDIFQYLKSGKSGLWLVFVGVDYYQYLPALKCAVADCVGLVKAFRESTQEFPKAEVFCHVSKYDSSPITPELIQATLSKVAQQSRAQDTVLFYFAGHGVLEPKTEKLYLCLTQTQKDKLPETGLAIEDLLEQLKQSKIRRQVVILDACHSGGAYFFRSGNADELQEPDAVSAGFTQKLDQVLQQHARYAKNLYALLACASDERSWELPELGHGAFTYALIEGVRGKAANNNGYIEVDHLYRYVRDETERLVGKQQKPQRVVFADEDIILGHVPASLGQTAVEFMQSLDRQSVARLTKAERKDCYEKAFLGGLIREYPEISEAEQNARARLANLLELSRRETQSIENANLLMCRVRQHERSVKRLLYITRIVNQDNFIALRNQLNVDPALTGTFERIEVKLHEQFQNGKIRKITRHISNFLTYIDRPLSCSTRGLSERDIWLSTIHRFLFNKITQKIVGSTTVAAALFFSIYKINATPTQFSTSSHLPLIGALSQWNLAMVKPEFLWIAAEGFRSEGKLQKAIDILGYIPVDYEIHDEAQKLISDLHTRTWEIAQEYYNKGQQDEAVKTAESIESDSPYYEASKVAAFEWRQIWENDNLKHEKIQILSSSSKLADLREAINICSSLINPEWKKESSETCLRVEAQILFIEQRRRSGSESVPPTPGTTPRGGGCSNCSPAPRNSTPRNSTPPAKSPPSSNSSPSPEPWSEKEWI